MHHEGIWRSGGVAPLILNLGARGRCVISSRAGLDTLEERKNPLPLPRIKPLFLDHLVTGLTELLVI